MPWRRILPGSALFVFGWLGLTWLFGLYVANFGSYARTHGTLAGVVLLMWFYLTAVLLLIGAELNEVLQKVADRRGSRLDKELGGLPGSGDVPGG